MPANPLRPSRSPSPSSSSSFLAYPRCSSSSRGAILLRPVLPFRFPGPSSFLLFYFTEPGPGPALKFQISFNRIGCAPAVSFRGRASGSGMQLSFRSEYPARRFGRPCDDKHHWRSLVPAWQLLHSRLSSVALLLRAELRFFFCPRYYGLFLASSRETCFTGISLRETGMENGEVVCIRVWKRI